MTEPLVSMLFASGERGSAMKTFFKVAIIISSGIAWNDNGNLKLIEI